ncbi:hypothetical protein ACFL54_09880, partial [Planctomycetota bacterium]
PKTFQNVLNFWKTTKLPKSYLPMLIVPFLRDSQLEELGNEGVSGIDLCGNGVVIAPNKFAIYRSGAKNRFPSTSTIKNIYRKNSSMIARVFLTQAKYDTVQIILSTINQKNQLVKYGLKNPMRISFSVGIFLLSYYFLFRILPQYRNISSLM